jgi:hypothetical protein
MLCFIQLKQINNYQYYGWFDIDQNYKKIIYFFELIRPLTISLLLGFLPEQSAAIFAVLAINCIQILGLAISTIYCLNKLIIIMKIAKTALSLLITVQIVIDSSNVTLSLISCIFAITITAIEII